MTTRGPLAYGHARIRACRSRLLTREEAAPLFTASDDASIQRVLAALDLEHPFGRLLRVYRTAIRGYGHAAPLFRALLRLHEIENVKLLWRVAIARQHHDRIARLWLDLGDLATVAILDPGTPGELAKELAKTPYAAIAATVARVHEGDLAAAELAFDRWASQQLLGENARLPRRESLTRRLIASVLEERDAQLPARGATWFGLTSVVSHQTDITALRQERLRLCRRAFVGDPFLLAPPVAVILLAEAELRAVRALVERQGDNALDAPLAKALAGSQIGV